MPGNVRNVAMAATAHSRESRAITTNSAHKAINKIAVILTGTGKIALTTTASTTSVSAGNPDFCDSTAKSVSAVTANNNISIADASGPSSRYSHTIVSTLP